MERLTVKSPNGCENIVPQLTNGRVVVTCKALCKDMRRGYTPEKSCENCDIQKAFDKLSAYEDTGLEAAEVAELKTKLKKCKELLRMAVNELEEKMSDLCETVGDMNSVYSPCLICVNQQKCKSGVVSVPEWIHADKVEEVLKNER